MYHYVRDAENTRFPDLKTLSVGEFRNQIAYIQKYYRVIGAEELLDAVANKTRLPPRSILLTFDDGYRDHLTKVLPILSEAQMPACFFPCARSVMENVVLDVNKIHFVLASVDDKDIIIDHLFELLGDNRSRHSLPESTQLWERFVASSYSDPNIRFDSIQVLFIKNCDMSLPLHCSGNSLLTTRVHSHGTSICRWRIFSSYDPVECMSVVIATNTTGSEHSITSGRNSRWICPWLSFRKLVHRWTSGSCVIHTDHTITRCFPFSGTAVARLEWRQK